jgi:two-component system phosphate regulon sensor histidine kinase PhoR
MEKSNKPIFAALSSGLLPPVIQIQQNIELLKKHCNYPDQSISEETFSFTENAIENILGFIESFQFLNSSDQLKMNMNPHWFSFQDLIIQIREELRNLNLDTSRLSLVSLPHQLKVYTDRYLISRILINLLSNALKFSGKKVELNISISKNKLNINVCDYGIGIPEHQLKEIFNPFVKGENASKFPGTGIGLSVVTKAVDCLDGTVTVHTELQKKTEFQVVLPYHQPRKTNPETKNNKLVKNAKIQLHHD